MTAEQKAERAAERCMKVRGHVVIGYEPNILGIPSVGDVLTKFAGAFLQNYDLVVTDTTDRIDWDQQFLLLFPGRPDTHPPTDGQKFFQCRLQKVAQ